MRDDVGATTDAADLREVFGTAAHAAVPTPDRLAPVITRLFRAALKSAEYQRTTDPMSPIRVPGRSTGPSATRSACFAAFAQQLPVMLKGRRAAARPASSRPMAHDLGRPLITVSCHDDPTTADLVGRYRCAAVTPNGWTAC